VWRNQQECKGVFHIRKALAQLAMLDPRDLEDLVALARAGSFSGAARRRGVAVSTLSRRIEALEAELKLRLVDRQANGTRLTRQGEQIAALAEPLSEHIARIDRAADALRAGGQKMPVRVSATEIIIADYLAPTLPVLFRSGCDFPVHLQVQRDVVSLAGRDADIAVRMVRPEGASLVIRKLPETELRLFCSRAYLGGRDPATLDLREERIITYDDSFGRIPETDWIGRLDVAPAVCVRTNSTRAQMLAVAAGAGIALLPRRMAARQPALVELPIPTGTPNRVPFLAVHRDLHRDPAIRKVHRWILGAFDAERKMRSMPQG
jgi:DNA-binding transcriptional LysR family regulator